MTYEDILKSIELTGAVIGENAQVCQVIVGPDSGNIQRVLNLSSGLPRLHNNIVNKFELILAQPVTLTAMSPFEMRCCFCRRVIAYPCWYHVVKYVVNHFHYFICFDVNDKEKPTTKCYKR